MLNDTGQEEQFRVLYQQTFSRITGLVTRRSRSPEDAADAVAETYLTAWRRWDQAHEVRLRSTGCTRRHVSCSRTTNERRELVQ